METVNVKRYYIRPGWVTNSWAEGGGYQVFAAVDPDTHRSILRLDYDNEDDLIAAMRHLHPEAVRVVFNGEGWVPAEAGKEVAA